MGKALETLEMGMELVLEEMKAAKDMNDFVGLGGLLSALGDAAANLGKNEQEVEGVKQMNNLLSMLR